MSTSTSIRMKGVAATLESLRQEVHDGMRERLVERKNAGRLDISDEEVEALATIAATLARTAAADGIGEAYQMGVNRSVEPDEHDRPTGKPPSSDGASR